MEKVEFLILRNLLNNEKYVRKVIPFIKSEYFEDANQKVIFPTKHGKIEDVDLISIAKKEELIFTFCRSN